MKHIAYCLLIAGFVLATPVFQLRADDNDVPPGLKKKGGVPPGLQKKGGLPPGQAKKQAVQEQSQEAAASAATVTIPSLPAAPAVAPVLPPTPASPVPAKPSAGIVVNARVPEAPTVPETATPTPKLGKEIQEKQARLDSEVADLDTMCRQAAVRDRLVVRLYNHGGVSPSAVAAQQKAYPALGMGSISVANFIARSAKVPAETILTEHASGRDWGTIAVEHKLSLHDLLLKLNEVRGSAHDAQHDATAAERRK